MKHYTTLLLSLSVIILQAQTMRTIPNFGKLPGPVVHKILQDEEGYIWYATTESGLCRDNGYQIDMFVGDAKDGFSRLDRFVREMCLTPDHQLLFATNTGAWLLDKRTYRIERFDTVVTRGHVVQSVAYDESDHSYWLSMGGSVFHFNHERKLLKSYDIRHDGEPQRSLTLFLDSSHRL